MTNAEKFEEVFGMKIDGQFPEDPCDIVDHDICVNHHCGNTCPVYNFWKKEYREK